MVTPRCEAHPLYPRPLECEGCVRVAEVIATQQSKASRAVGEEASTKARERASERRVAIADCLMCDQSGYVNGVVCHHDTNAMLAGKKGIEKVRAALRAAQRGGKPNE